MADATQPTIRQEPIGMSAARRVQSFWEKHGDTVLRALLGLVTTATIAAFALAWNIDLRVSRIETERAIEAPYNEEMRQDVRRLLEISTQTQSEIKAMRHEKGN